MREIIWCVTMAAMALLPTPGPSSPARELTFTQRVEAQRVIERVYHSHQIGATRSFEQAVPQTLLERKVRTYLRQSLALEKIWGAPITAAMLDAELRRIAAGSRLPDRLLEVYAALGDDPFVIRETLVRAALADRLARGRFASDRRIHAAAREEAEEIRGRLIAGEIDPAVAGPGRRLVVLRRGEDDDQAAPARAPSTALEEIRLAPDAFEQARARVPRGAGSIGPVLDQPDAFVIDALLSEEPGRVTLARYGVAKVSWDTWWSVVGMSLDPAEVRAVADVSAALPRPANAVAASCVADDSWDNGILDDVPASRSDHTAVWTGSLMIVWGGSSRADGARYDPVTDTWSPTTADGAPSARRHHTAVWTGTRMIVWGGYGPPSGAVDTGASYDPIADVWTSISTAGAPAPRSQHTAIWTGAEMIVWGGEPPPFAGVLGPGGRYDPASDSWVDLPVTNAPADRFVHTAVWTGTEMIVWGGITFAGDLLGDGKRYSPTSNTWIDLPDTGAPAPRHGHTAVWTGAEMIVWGGTVGAHLDTDTGARYSLAGDSWTPTTTAGAPDVRVDHTALWTGTRMIVWGGINLPCCDYSEPRDTGALYDPATDTWSPTTLDGAPAARSSHSAVWTGSEMIVWGGQWYGVGVFNTINILHNTGGRYDPATDSWRTTMGGTPAGVSGHRTVWTGTLMIDWGLSNFLYAADVATGGRYDPMLDSWSPTATQDAPSPRSGHSAVWTGSEMILWGGGYPDYTDSGGSYDPVADTWVATSPSGAPEPRSGHTAVWTGNRMIVWGGLGAGGRLDTGGAYDPITGSWTALATLDAPDPRTNHTAVWTGSEMIVWGGRVSSTLSTDTGGRYDPASDSWSATSIAGSPSARGAHTAVWTGGRMIVWGGTAGSAPPGLTTGGLYDPAADTWTSTAMDGAPAPRTGHTAIWTGQVMVVWGGGGLDTGGRYDPAADTWAPTSTLGAPAGRSGHTSVWTGSHMLIWGGIPYTGGRYGLDQSPDADQDGFTTCAGDCDDTEDQIHPVAEEICDGKDNDCDAHLPAAETDRDGDGFLACGRDCNDLDASVNPDGVDLPGDPLDQNCDGSYSCDPRGNWGNHGQYVRCVSRTCATLVERGLVTAARCESLVRDASRSDAGKKKTPRLKPRPPRDDPHEDPLP